MAVPHPAGFGFGFGGAPVIALDRMPDLIGPSGVIFFGLDLELRRHFDAANSGAASFVRQSTFCMLPWTQACAGPCRDIGMVSATDPEQAFRDVAAISRRVTALGLRPALIGCDHTASAANLTGVIQDGSHSVVYLYLDAHFRPGPARAR
jgi:arginase family enzyme